MNNGNYQTIADISVPTGLFINGEWRESSSGARFGVEDPSTEQVIATVADATAEDSLEALASAAAAQQAWGQTSARSRAEILRTAFDLIQKHSDEIACLITAEMGKPLIESRGEVAYGGEFFRWFSEQAAHLKGGYGTAPAGGFKVLTTRQPVGPSLLITPWNFPLAMGTRKIGAALAAGCTVIFKPAAQTPLTAAILVQLLAEAGVPKGVVNFIPTNDPAEQSRVLMGDPRLRKVSFTGSTTTGSTLLRQAADHVLRSSMELGGNGPFIVLDDADVEAAVDGAMLAKYRNGGESCVAANRFIVHKDVAVRFTQALVKRTKELKVGCGSDDGVNIGPLIEARAKEKISTLVSDAVKAGAKVLCGGESLPGPGHYYAPTVLAEIPLHAGLAHEEIFGPVVAIFTFSSIEEAISLANDTPYGLAAFLYTRDLNRAFQISDRLEAGMVGVNRGLVSEVGAPFGGIKESGLGREGGDLGIEEYLETKYLAVDIGPSVIDSHNGQVAHL